MSIGWWTRDQKGQNRVRLAIRGCFGCPLEVVFVIIFALPMDFPIFF